MSTISDATLAAIAAHWDENQYGPSMRDMSQRMGVGLSTAQYRVQLLIESGWATRSSAARSLRLTDDGRAKLKREQMKREDGL